MASSAPPVGDVVAEARRLSALADAAGVPLRLMGGVAIHLVVGDGDGADAKFVREPKDIDVMTDKKAGRAVAHLLEAHGYRADVEFNTLHGHRRLLFYDDVHARQLDVFVGSFEMCHAIPIGERLAVRSQTLAPAELLLMKLQIAELNPKDQLDILRLLHAFEIGEDDEVINGRYLGELCAKDWGLWRTVQLNLQRTDEAISSLDSPSHLRRRLQERLERLRDRLDAAPKSRRWRLRARVGEHVRWYEEPEEAG